MTEADVAPLWHLWPVTPPCTVDDLVGGTNSHVWRVTDARGGRFVLRQRPVALLPRQRTESALLRELAALGLSFRVPLPLPTTEGDDIVMVDDASFAVLTPFLRGGYPTWQSLSEASAAGRALAELDDALRCLTLPPPAAVAPPFSDLAAWFAASEDDLIAAIWRLPGTGAEHKRISDMLSGVLARAPALSAALPWGIVHRDYSHGNFLMEGGRVVSILDFEFVGPDLRALDLVTALNWWNLPEMEHGDIWPHFAAFARAYLADFALTPDEMHALPDLFRLRDAASLVHRMARYVAGQEIRSRMTTRIAHTFWREDWLTTNRDRLVDEALRWLP